jgi:hypothetical protein
VDNSVAIPLLFILLPTFGIVSEIYYLEIGENYPLFLRYTELLIILSLLLYSLLPMFLSVERYFVLRGLKNSIIEFEFFRKAVYVGVPTLIIVMMLFLYTYDPDSPNFTYALFSGLILIVGSALLRVVVSISRKNFWYYYARGYLRLLLTEDDRSKRISNFVVALNSYNKYINRSIGLRINNLNNLCSQVVSGSIGDKYEVTRKISSSFEDNDKLRPIDSLYKLVKSQNAEQFLSKEPLSNKIKEWGAFLAATIPVIISIIQLLLYTP